MHIDDALSAICNLQSENLQFDDEWDIRESSVEHVATGKTWIC